MNWDYWIQLLGYPFVALGIALESMGLPTPGETLLLLGAALAANGKLNIYYVIASAALGAILGDNAGYYLGRRHGRAILHRFMEFDDAKLARSEAFFRRHGPKAVFLARFVPIVRMFAAVLAGINHMPASTFALYNAAGGIAWAVVMGSLGYFFGQNLPLIERWIHRIGTVLAILILVGVLLFWLNRRWQGGVQSLRSSSLGRLILGWQAAQRWVHARGMGVGITIYLALFAASSWLFGQLVDAVLEKDPVLMQLDRTFTPWLHTGVNEFSTWLESLVWLTDVRLLMGITLLAAFWLWRQSGAKLETDGGQGPVLAELTLFNSVGALAIGLALQLWVQRPLPGGAELRWWETGYSFPDLSAMLSVTVYGWLVYIQFRRRSWRARVNAYTIVTFVVITGGIITLYLGYALPSDVVAGWALGLLWLGLPISLLMWRQPHLAASKSGLDLAR